MDNPPKALVTLRRDLTKSVSSMCFLRKGDKTYLVCGGSDSTLYIWDLSINRIIYEHSVRDAIISIHHYENAVETFEIITQERNGTITFYLVNEKLELLTHHYIHDCGMTFCRLIVSGNSVVLPQGDGNIRAIDLYTDNFKMLQLFRKPDQNAFGHIMAIVDIMIDTKVFLLGGYESGDVLLWDFETGRICAHNKLRESITSMVYDKETGRVVVGNTSHVLQLFQVASDLRIHIQCEISITNPGCAIVKLRPRGPLLISGGWDSRIRIFSWKSLKPLAVLTENSENITDIAFSPGPVKGWEAHLIAVSSTDGAITLWDLY